MLDSLVTNAEALTYIKLKIVSNIALLILVAFIFGRLGLKLLWYWSEPLREKISKWWKKRKEHEETMEAIDKLN